MYSIYFGLFVQIFDRFNNKMINIKLLDNLTLNSLIFVYLHLKSNKYLSNYNMNLLEHVDQTLKINYP